MARLLTIAREYAKRITGNEVFGGEAGAPVASFWYRASKGDRSMAAVTRWCSACSTGPGSNGAARSTARNFGFVSMCVSRGITGLDERAIAPRIRSVANVQMRREFRFHNRHAAGLFLMPP